MWFEVKLRSLGLGLRIACRVGVWSGVWGLGLWYHLMGHGAPCLLEDPSTVDTHYHRSDPLLLFDTRFDGVLVVVIVVIVVIGVVGWWGGGVVGWWGGGVVGWWVLVGMG